MATIDLESQPSHQQFADVVGKSRQAISDLVKRGILVKGGTWADWLRAHSEHLTETAAGRASSDDGYDLVSERARLAHHQANIAALDEEVKRKTLIPAEQVRSKWQDMLASFRARLLSMPTRVAAACVGRDEVMIEQSAREIVHQALDEMARGDGID